MNTLLGPTDEQIDRIFARVQQHITADLAPAPIPAKRSRRIRIRRAGFAAAGVMAIAAALVVTGLIVLPGHGHGESAQAVEFLNAAAETTIKTSDPVVGPGQYLRISTDADYMATVFNPSGPDTYYMAPTTGALYIPADRSQQWVWERHDLPITTVFGTAAQKAQVPLGPRTPSGSPETNGIFRADAGAFYGEPAEDYYFADQPRDPNALLAYFQKRYGNAPNGANAEIWTQITDELRTGQVPADLRAALYKMAALIPGIQYIGSDVTLDGRTGVAIGLANSANRDDIIIDPATGLMIGERNVSLKAAFGIPAGTSNAWTSITTTVVDTAP
jgi:RNA polymerase sigma-70 factor (ECF subfamily)